MKDAKCTSLIQAFFQCILFFIFTTLNKRKISYINQVLHQFQLTNTSKFHKIFKKLN